MGRVFALAGQQLFTHVAAGRISSRVGRVASVKPNSLAGWAGLKVQHVLIVDTVTYASATADAAKK